MEQAYLELEAIQDISILKITNQMNTHHSCIILIVMYQESILCEVVMRNSKKSALYYANCFVNTLLDSEDINKFHQLILKECGRMVEKSLIYYHTDNKAN